MLFRTHFVLAFLFFLLTFKFVDHIFLFGLFFLFATFFVDIDSSKSRMGKLLFFRPLQWLISHRGVFHSLIFGFLVSSLIFLLDSSAGFGFLMGYLLHLFLDCFSFSGIALFWPFSKRKISGFVKTGGIVEEILFVLTLLVDIYLVGKIVFNMLFSTT